MSVSQSIMKVLSKGPLTAQEIADETRLTLEAAKKALSGLVSKKYITRGLGIDQQLEYRSTEEGREYYRRNSIAAAHGSSDRPTAQAAKEAPPESDASAAGDQEAATPDFHPPAEKSRPQKPPSRKFAVHIGRSGLSKIVTTEDNAKRTAARIAKKTGRPVTIFELIRVGSVRLTASITHG